MNLIRRVVSIDIEAAALHGAAFAAGGVVLEDDGTVATTLYLRAPTPPNLDPWVTQNVLPALQRGVNCETARELRTRFWDWILRRADIPYTVLVVDRGWPVEARVLAACVDDDPTRAFALPYLHELGSWMRALGLDPLANHPDLAQEAGTPLALPLHDRAHDPLCDALVSGAQAVAALRRLGQMAPRRP